MKKKINIYPQKLFLLSTLVPYSLYGANQNKQLKFNAKVTSVVIFNETLRVSIHGLGANRKCVSSLIRSFVYEETGSNPFLYINFLRMTFLY